MGELVRALLARGSAAALSAFVPSLRPALLLAIFLMFYGAEVQAAVGLTASYFGIASVLTAGFTISAIFALAPHAKSRVSDLGHLLSREFRVGTGAVFALCAAGVVLGLLLPPIIDVEPALFLAFWFTSLGSLALMPYGATLSGAFQARNRDLENLILSVAATVLQLAIAVLAGVLGASPVVAVVAAGAAGVASDLLALAYRTWVLDETRGGMLAVIRTGMREFGANPLNSLRELPRYSKGALDGLVLMTVFTIAGTVAAGHSARDGAIVVMVVAVLRAIVIPMKQFGLVGGRLIRQSGDASDSFRRLRSLTGVVLLMLVCAAMLLLILRAATPALDSIPWLIIGLMAAQLALEPVTGFVFAVQKVLIDPAIGLKALVIISFAVTIPALVVVMVLQAGTAELVWSIVFAARVIFAFALGLETSVLRRRTAVSA